MPQGRRGKYLGFVAHEIKNPLATVLWACDLLKRMEKADRSGERAEKMIDVSLRSLRRMRRLIDDYFTIERLLEHGYELRRERIELRELLGQALEQLADKDGIATEGWSVEVQGELMGDPDMLKRALRSLLEHMARGSEKARLTLTAAAGELRIAAEQPPSPLIPPEPEERPSGDATGGVLGFALAARILEEHGARIEEREGVLCVRFAAA